MRVAGDGPKLLEFGPKMSPEDLSLATRTEETKYMRDITPDERVSFSESVVELMQQDDVAAEQAAISAKHFRDLRKHIQTQRKTMSAAMRTGRREVEGKIHVFLDRANGKVHSYDDNGEFIATRRMNATEAQIDLTEQQPTS